MKITKFFAIFLISLAAIPVWGGQELSVRTKRFIFPPGADVGVLVAIAIPLDIPNRSVFVSYNFEANFPPPTSASDIIPGPLKFFEYRNLGQKSESSERNETESNEKEKRDVREHLLTRKKVYKMLESKLQNNGHRGKACLLRAICESAEGPLHELTGVIGDLLHIILTPSSSVQEDLHPEYYKAEELGRSGDCSKYKKYCPQCILDYISQVLHF
ncbi:uncharacterized protein DMENIID0001_030420 [Sergentomyia squamirostris]